MPDRVFQPIAGFAMRHERALTIIGAAWFAISCASYARFVDLPPIPFVTDRYAFWLAGAWNAIWWGFVHPGIERHRLALGADAESEETPAG